MMTRLQPVPFSTLFERLKAGDSIEAAAVHCKVPPYTVNYLWLRYFRSWLGTERSIARKKLRRTYTQNALLKQVANLPEKCGLRIMAERANRLGCAVDFQKDTANHLILHALTVEGQGIAVYEVTAAFSYRSTGNRVAHFLLSRSKLDRNPLVALVVNVKDLPIRIFLLRSEEILTAYFKRGKATYQLKVTADRPRYHRRVPGRKLRMWDYEGDAVDSLLLNLKIARAK